MYYYITIDTEQRGLSKVFSYKSNTTIPWQYELEYKKKEGMLQLWATVKEGYVSNILDYSEGDMGIPIDIASSWIMERISHEDGDSFKRGYKQHSTLPAKVGKYGKSVIERPILKNLRPPGP